MTAVMSIRDLVVRFRTPRGVLEAVRGVTLDIPEGASVGIVGESGSGKTVLSRAAMGLLSGSNVDRSGSVTFDGAELVGLPRDQVRQHFGTGIAMIFQDPMTALNPVRRVGVQVAEGLRIRLGMSRKDAAARTAELLAIAEDAIAEECFAPADDDQPLGITARTDGGYLAVLIHDGERVCTLVGCDLDSISERICDFDLPSDKVAVPIDRADLDAFTRAVLGAVHSLDREIERMERGLAILCGPHRDIRLADAETARANLNRLVTILCNANK